MVIKAIQDYLAAKGIAMPDDLRFGYIIDGVYAYIGNDPVLMIGLPPVSHYTVYETEYTEKLLCSGTAVAV